MKKALPLILALVLCLTLCACGGEGNSTQTTPETTEGTSVASKEEMLASAKEFFSSEYLNEYKENPVRAEQNYVGQIVKFVGYVEQISADSVEVLPMNAVCQFSANCRIKVALSTDEIMQLSTGDTVAIVGEIAELPIVMNTAYTYPVSEHIAGQLDHMVEIFGNDDDGDGTIEETDGSFGFFSAYKDAFPLLTGAEIKEELVGSWTIKDKFDDEFEHTFNADGTAITAYKGGADTCYWLVEGDYIYWGTGSLEIDTERNTRMEVRRLGENILIIYENDTGSYSGMTYSMEGAYAILIKK